MKMISLIAPSSAGKDAILKKLIERNYVQPIISDTNRPIRSGELQGREYNFLTNKEIKHKIDNNEYIEKREYKVQNGDTWIYGVNKNSFDLNSDITYGVIIDYSGLKQMEEYLYSLGKRDDLISIYIDVPLQERLSRSLQREGKLTDEQCLEICRRAISDDSEIIIAKKYTDYVVNNEGYINNTINRILNIMEEDI